MPRFLDAEELDLLAIGSWILGTGGGGSPYASHLVVRQFYEEGGRIALLDPDELADDDAIAVVSTMGAPLVFQERMTDGAFALKPVRIMEAFLGRPFRAVMTVEIGGCNAFQPLLVAAASGLPVVERRHLDRVAALRIGFPANAGLPPFIGWPKDLAAAMRGSIHMVGGGHEYDGRVLVPLDRAAVRREAQRIADGGISSVAITSVFSPLTDECEREAAGIVREVMPAARITLSHEIGRIGLLERENAALLNAGLQGLAQRTTAAFVRALRDSGIAAPLYLTQNDGTIVQGAVAERHPVYCFASGPTNSMRGAAFLSGLNDALVVDVGGTTTDVGGLKGGFPRQANAMVEIGGVRTLFRMPDLISIGLGGGTEIADDGRHAQ